MSQGPLDDSKIKVVSRPKSKCKARPGNWRELSFGSLKVGESKRAQEEGVHKDPGCL